MGQEESKLVEEVVESTESTENKEEFNPLAFATDVDKYSEEEKKEDTEDATDTVESKEEKTKEEEEKEKEEGWSWDAEAKEEAEKSEEDYSWEEEKESKKEEVTAEEALTWSKVGKELGLEINSRDEFVNTLNEYSKQMQNTQQPEPQNNQISELRSYLNFKDRDLVAEELKADGIEESEIEESLDKLEDSGMLKMKAKSIRRVISNSIDQQTQDLRNRSAQEDQQRKANAKKAKKELQGTIKNMDKFMGGSVTKKQKEEVYRYATGNMMKDIYADHANVADVAMFMLYRKQIEKILRSQGLEDGKASIMNSIVSPSSNSGKSNSNFKVKSGSFDPKAFMNE